MTTRTELALQRLLTALQAQVTAGSLPPLHRNEALPSELDTFQTAHAFINVLDGRATVEGQALGEGLGRYELRHEAEIEWMVDAAQASAREALFDQGLEAIAAAIESLARDGDPLDDAEIVSVERSHLATDGLPTLKAASLLVALTYTSPRPF